MRAQQTVTETVEGAYPHATGIYRQHGRQPRQHFFGGLVGKGHREYTGWRYLPRLNQPRDASSEYAGLAGSCAREDQRGLWGKRDSSELFRIEVVQEVLHRRIIRPRCSDAAAGTHPGRGNPVFNSLMCPPGNQEIRPARGAQVTNASDTRLIRSADCLRIDIAGIYVIHLQK